MPCPKFGRLDSESCRTSLDPTCMAIAEFNRPKSGTDVIVCKRRKAADVPCYRPNCPDTKGI